MSPADRAPLATPSSVRGGVDRGGGPVGRQRNRRGEGQRLAEEILAAARDIIEDTGDESQVTLRGIARRVGIAAPSVYQHFSGVPEICQRVVVDAYRTFTETASLGPDTNPPGHRIRTFAAGYLRFARAHPQLYRLLFTRANPSEIPETGDRGRALFTELTAVLHDAVGPGVGADEARGRALGLWFELHGVASLPPANPRFAWPLDDQLLDAALRRAGISAADPAEHHSGRGNQHSGRGRRGAQRERG